MPDIFLIIFQDKLRTQWAHAIPSKQIITSGLQFQTDWKVCIAQPRSRVRNFGRNARLDAQIL
jgi:hypothetical protein